MDNNVDTHELDPTLKYDENKQIIQNMIESKPENRKDERSEHEQHVRWSKLNSLFFSDKVSKAKREEDMLKTESNLIRERQLRNITPEMQRKINRWKADPLNSHIDIQNIDDYNEYVAKKKKKGGE